MAVQKGRDLLVKTEDGASGFVTVAGLRARSLSFNAQAIDSTDQGSVGRWRELLEGAGVRRASVSGSGLFRDMPSDALIRQAFFDGVIKQYQLVIPDFGTIEGAFQITALEFSGQHDSPLQFDIALESAGPLAFTAH